MSAAGSAATPEAAPEKHSGDEVMRKASTELLEQGTQMPSPAPDLIPAQTKNQPRTHIGIGTVNGGTSECLSSGHSREKETLFCWVHIQTYSLN
jgi:hypothetical protein